MKNLHIPFLNITFIFGLFLFVSSVQASVGWIADSGQLTGATGVNVNGTLYSVSFIDDTCINTFDGCDSVDDFAFKTEEDAVAAAAALLEQVILDTNSVMLTVDSDPELVSGCDQFFTCKLIVPYFPNVQAGFSNVAWADNWAAAQEVMDTTAISAISRDQYLETNGDVFVYAKFTSAQPVPVPAAVWLFGSALLGFAGISKRKCT
jgi:hypothetical protein